MCTIGQGLKVDNRGAGMSKSKSVGKKARSRPWNLKFPINKWNKNTTDVGRLNVKRDSYENTRGKKKNQRASNSIKNNNKSLNRQQ